MSPSPVAATRVKVASGKNLEASVGEVLIWVSLFWGTSSFDLTELPLFWGTWSFPAGSAWDSNRASLLPGSCDVIFERKLFLPFLKTPEVDVELVDIASELVAIVLELNGVVM